MQLNKMLPYSILAVFSFAFLFSFPGTVNAVDLTLTWDRPDDDRVSGYKVFYGEFGTDFQSMHRETIDSPEVTSLVIHDLNEWQIFGFSVKSIDSIGNESDFSEIVYHLVPSDDDMDSGSTADVIPEEIIIDNDNPGTSWDGSWKISAGENAYGNTSVYSIDVGDAYAFQGELAGYYDVSLRWTYYPSRCSSVNVDIYDGDYLVSSLVVDQQSGDGQWNTLGEHEFNGTARVVIRSGGGCSTNVDGVRFVKTPSLTEEI